MAGTIVTPVDALMRFHHYTAHFPDDYDIDGVTVTALLKLSGASATDIRNFLSGIAEDPSGLLTPSAPSPAGCKSGGLGAQDATAYDRGRECLPAPSLIPQRDVPGTQVPMDDLAPTVMQPSLQAAYTSMGAASGGATISPSPSHDALHVTPPPNPAQCTTRAPSVGMEATWQLQEAENHDDVPAKVDHADEEDQVDGLA